jgi:hypothetical protein
VGILVVVVTIADVVVVTKVELGYITDAANPSEVSLPAGQETETLTGAFVNCNFHNTAGDTQILPSPVAV